jgi:hypothetical protein
VYWDAYSSEEMKGDSEIISYNLQWDIGTGGVEWTDLIGNPVSSLLTSFSATSMVAPGQYYKFRLRASNIYGFGAFSEEFSFKASEEPEQLALDGLLTEISET